MLIAKIQFFCKMLLSVKGWWMPHCHVSTNVPQNKSFFAFSKWCSFVSKNVWLDFVFPKQSNLIILKKFCQRNNPMAANANNCCHFDLPKMSFFVLLFHAIHFLLWCHFKATSAQPLCQTIMFFDTLLHTNSQMFLFENCNKNDVSKWSNFGCLVVKQKHPVCFLWHWQSSCNFTLLACIYFACNSHSLHNFHTRYLHMYCKYFVSQCFDKGLNWAIVMNDVK